MAGRDPRWARILGLWTASWLAGLLLAGLLWVGDLSVQWPVLVVPLAWALNAMRPRGRQGGDGFGGRSGGRTSRTDTVQRSAVRDPRGRPRA
jgi:hypothetical protein